MAATTLVTKDHANFDVTLTLAGSQVNGALYKDASRPLATPTTVQYKYVLGQVGAKGNDKLLITASTSAIEAATGLIVTGVAKLEVSVPRNPAWVNGYTENLINFISFLTGGNGAPAVAMRAAIADAIVP